MTTSTDRPKHYSMIRELHLADVFTLGNAACGMASIFLSMRFVGSGDTHFFLWAAVMAPAALIFDILDGKVARWRHRHSPLGRELDSLADILSFGAAPAVLAFAAGINGGWDIAALIYFVCCGVSRLARFNVTAEQLSDGGDKVAYFEGTPIPTSVLLSVILGLCCWWGKIGEQLPWGQLSLAGWMLHPLALLFVLSGSLMISKTLRVPKL